MNACYLNILLLVIVVPGQVAKADQRLYLATRGEKAIVAYRINAETGELAFESKTGLVAEPGCMAFSPDECFVYVTMSAAGGASVATLQRTSDGSLVLRANTKLRSRAAYVRTDNTGKLLLVCHYVAGGVSIYRIVNGICTAEMTGYTNTARTAHCVALDPSGRFVFVPHTTPNKIYQFSLDEKQGKLLPNEPPFVDGPEQNQRYHQPRHYVHHPHLDMAYTSNEYGGGISAWDFEPRTGTLQRLATLSTLPPNSTDDFFAADIQLTGSGRFAYVSNRDQTKRPSGDMHQDTLAGFSLDPQTGEMALVGHWPGPNEPNSFCIEASDQFLYAAGTNSMNLFAYRIDQRSGQLDHFATYPTVGSSSWVMCGD